LGQELDSSSESNWSSFCSVKLPVKRSVASRSVLTLSATL